MKMENNLNNRWTINKNFKLTDEQIRFIDDKVLYKDQKLKDVVKELVKQSNNNFQEKDVARIMKLYRAIKTQEAKLYSKDRWTQEELKILKNAIEERGQITNVSALAKKLKPQLKPRTYGAIMAQMHRLIKPSKCVQEKNNELQTVSKEKNTSQTLTDLFNTSNSMIIPDATIFEIINEEVNEKFDLSSNGHSI